MASKKDRSDKLVGSGYESRSMKKPKPGAIFRKLRAAAKSARSTNSRAERIAAHVLKEFEKAESRSLKQKQRTSPVQQVSPRTKRVKEAAATKAPVRAPTRGCKPFQSTTGAAKEGQRAPSFMLRKPCGAPAKSITG